MEASSIQRLLQPMADKVRQATCNKHGKYSAVIMQGHDSGCPACMRESNSKEAKAEVTALLKQNERLKVTARFAAADIPRRFAECRFAGWLTDTEDQVRILSVAAEYAENFEVMLADGRCMIFCGMPGTGKTHLAVATLYRVLEQGFTGRYLPLSAATRMVKDTWRSSDKTEDMVLAELSEPDLLVLDEAGVQFETDTEAMVIYEIVNARYEQGKPIIFTSNDSIEEMVKTLGARVIDRLRENGGKAYAFNWESFRKARVGQ